MPRVYSDPAVLRYHASGHPEAPFRVERSAARLQAAGHPLRVPDRPAAEADLLLAHDAEHLRALAGGDFADPDTPAHPGIDSIARVSVSGALSAAAAAGGGEPAFSLMRPPGHHAGRRRVAGFCYLNNLAVAVLRALADKSAARVAILDIDVHHGDGTEEIVLGREEIRFVSLHQSPLYPGTGLQSRGNCVDIPVAPGTDEAGYLRLLEPALVGLLDFKPDLLAVSAGFDTYKGCPLANLRLERDSYRRIGTLLAATKLKRFATLEGGYSEDLPVLIERFLDGFFS